VSAFLEHIARLKTAVSETYDLAQVPKWITDHTYLKGEKYSFKGHEFQEKVLSDTSRVVNTQKCSQIGMSEAQSRWVMGVCEIFPSFSVILTFPFSSDASDFCRTRIDPFIETSPRLRAAMHPDINNSDMKRINDSMLYLRGTNGKTQAISTPADAIVSDELDRSDPDVLGQFTSRLTHSNYKLRRNFSTPTIEGWGIALEMETSRRFKNLCKCHHCNHVFLPDYEEHVKIPDWSNDLKSITKTNLHKTRYLEAVLLCPHCGKEPSLAPEHREWVQENTLDNFEAAGFYISPFDAPAVITPTSLVVAGTSYAKYSEFRNQNLGKTSEEASEAMTLQDLNQSKTITSLESTQPHALGADMGLICHVCIGRLTLEGQFLIVHRETVTLGMFEHRKAELCRKYRVMITVCDSQPYVDMIQRLQKTDKNLYGGVYHSSIKKFEGDPDEGKLPIHTATINRDKAFDELLGKFKNREVAIFTQEDTLDEAYDKACLDMKRVQVFDTHQELHYTWVKSKTAVDHWHHATLYLYTACRLRATAAFHTPLLVPGFIGISKVNIKRLQGST
jgi:hypothetical protein